MDIGGKLNRFMDNSKHVLAVSYKPDSAEFNRSAKVILLGILIIGLLGYVISLIVTLITGSAL